MTATKRKVRKPKATRIGGLTWSASATGYVWNGTAYGLCEKSTARLIAWLQRAYLWQKGGRR